MPKTMTQMPAIRTITPKGGKMIMKTITSRPQRVTLWHPLHAARTRAPCGLARANCLASDL